MLEIQNKSVDTELTTQKIKNIEDVVVQPKNTSKQDEETLGYILKRKKAMETKRWPMEQKWALYIKQYEALFTPYRDGRSSSNVPLERAIIELFVAEATKRPTRFNFNKCIGYERQAMILEKVWKDDWSKNNRNSVILDNEYLTAIFGTSILYTGYSQKTRIISDFDGEDDEGKIKFQRKKWTTSKIDIESVDIRNFWIDDRAGKVEDAIDCCYDEYITREDFMNYKFDKNYQNLDKVAPVSYKWDNNKVFTLKEEQGNGEQKFIKITKYWNTELDRYYEVANDSILIKEHPILNATHSLPFVVRQYGKNIFSIYGYGICEALTMFKSEINTLREMLMDAIKRSNQEVIALWGGLTFDGNQFGYNNTIMKFKWNLQGNFQQLSGTPPNQAIFNYLQQLYKDIAIFVGIDIQNILGEPQQTAYQTAVQKESSLQRLNVVFRNRDSAFERLANLHKDNLQLFYPLKLVRKMVAIDKNDKPIEEVEKEYPQIQIPKIKGNKFVTNGEEQLFEITPEAIRGSVNIDVSTDLNAPTINEVDKEMKKAFFLDAGAIAQSYQINPALEELIPLNKAMRTLAEMNNIEVEGGYDSWVKEKKDALYKQLQDMMIQPTQEVPWQVSTEWQPPEIAQVNTPNI